MSEILATVGGTDISKYIIKDTYKMNAEPVSQSWTDGNFHEHRIQIRERVSGSFDVIFFDEDNGAFEDFLALLEANTTNTLLTCGLYVENKAAFEAFQVYYEITAKQHARTIDDVMVNKMTISVKEY